MCTQDSIQQFTQSQILGSRATIPCINSVTPPVNIQQRRIEVTPKHKHRAFSGRKIERSPLAELIGDSRINSEIVVGSNVVECNAICRGAEHVDALPDMALSLCTPLTPPRRNVDSSPTLEAELDEMIWEGIEAERIQQPLFRNDAQAIDDLEDMAMSICTPLSMPMSVCTPLSQTDMALSLCTPATPPNVAKELFRQPIELLQEAALQVATNEAQSAFGWNRLKSFQKGAVEAWAAGRNCFLLSGTGSGKTGCFVLPALVARRWHERQGDAARGPAPMAIVVSPIVALMRDQVGRLQKHGIAAAVHSPQCDDPHAWKRALSGEVVLLYTCPEMLFKLVETKQLQKLPKVSLLAIDESHCVSEWGFDFRPEYGQLSQIIEAVAETGYGGRTPPILCVTATCTEDVRQDVIRSLKLKAGTTDFVTGTMNRPNLHFAVEEWPDRSRMTRRLLEMFDVASLDQATVSSRRNAELDCSMPSSRSTTIVYVRRIAHCDHLARLLVSGGVKAAAYHSHLTREAKQTVQEAFNLGNLQAVIATIAFGMGIDKPDVRRVIHYGMPKCIESYSQESGRAGRDGKFACCTILFLSSDRANGESVILGESPVPTPQLHRSLVRLQKIFSYCRNTRHCRRAQLLEYLGENPCDTSSVVSSQPRPSAGTPGFCTATVDGPMCGRCDTCCSATPAAPTDVQSELLVLLQSAQALGMCARKQLIEMAYKANGGTSMKKQALERIVDSAVDEGFLDVFVALHRSYAVHSLSEKGRLRLQKGRLPEPFFVDVGATQAMRPFLNLPVWQVPTEASRSEDIKAKDLFQETHVRVVEERTPANNSECEVRDEAACSERSSRLCRMTSHPWFSSAVKWNRSGSSGGQAEEAGMEGVMQQVNQDTSALASSTDETAKKGSTGTTGCKQPSRRLRRSGSTGDQMEFPICRASSSSSYPQATDSLNRAVVTIRVDGAGGVGACTNGDYMQIGMHNDKPKFKQIHGNSICFFSALSWKINSEDDVGGWYYQIAAAHEGSLPPVGAWTTEGYDAWDAEPPPSVSWSQQVLVITVEGAGGVGASTNGTYTRIGTHNDRPKFKKIDGPAIIFYAFGWRINSVDDTGGWYYCQVSTADEETLPPDGQWTTVGYDASDAEPPPSVSCARHDDSNHRNVGILEQWNDELHGQTITVLDSDDDDATRESSASSMNDVLPNLEVSKANLPTCIDDVVAVDAVRQAASGNRLAHLPASSSSRRGVDKCDEGRHQAHLLQGKRPADLLQISPYGEQEQEVLLTKHPPALREDKPQKNAKRRRRTRYYTEVERAAATPFVEKLMEAADFNSNVKGGVTGFKQLMQQARKLSPPELRQDIDEVVSVFQSRSVHVHGYKLDEIIDRLRNGSSLIVAR